MSGNKSGFSISVSLVDDATKGLDALNKRIEALGAPAERFNKSMKKFGEVTGIARTAEGIKGLGDNALETARAMERMVSPLGLLTSGASLAGVGELTKRWAEFGAQMGRTAYVLDLPASKLSGFDNAAKLAGLSASQMETGLGGLQKNLRDFAFGRAGPEVASLFKAWGIHGTDAAASLGDIAEKIKGLDPATQARGLDVALGGHDLLPMLKGGRAGLQGLLKEAKGTGGNMTDEMIENAERMEHSWAHFGETISGVQNRLTDFYGPKLTGWLDSASHWIEQNKETADKITEIGIAVSSLGLIKPAAWVMKLLGLGGLIPGAGTAVLAGSGAAILAIPGDAGPNSAGVGPEQEAINRRNAIAAGALTPGQWWQRHAPSWLGGASGPNKEEFLRNATPLAERAAAETGVDSRLILAQAALETGYGQHAPGNNYFGIKGSGGPRLGTKEFINGQMVDTSASFAGYGSMADSFTGYANFIKNNPRYASLRNARGLPAQLDALARSGYATDPDYAGKLAGIVAGLPASGPVADSRNPNSAAAATALAHANLHPLLRAGPRVEKTLAGLPLGDALRAGAPAFGPLNDVPGAPTVTGGVHVEVTVKHDGAQVSAKSRATGQATTAPPRVETALGGFN